MLKIVGISKSYPGRTILASMDLELAKNQMLSVLGTSGTGKTTFLKIIAGLESPDQGDIFIDDENINHIPPQNRNMVYLYQEPLLFPHLNVFENLVFGLRLRKESKAQIQKKAQNLLQDLGIADQAKKMPHQLSGGQKQRVSFGRALIIRPTLLLLDEPFSSLDTQTRRQMQILLKKMMALYEITGIFVTHDLKEAMLMGDRLASLREGKLKMYANHEAFIKDKDTGVQEEINFWQQFNLEPKKS